MENAIDKLFKQPTSMFNCKEILNLNEMEFRRTENVCK